ncbi:PadR-like family transcriptional regulator [Marssonina coronariae]|uniref:PadR-like family transcriptional regulator n=1 Tax=Diplocarpon coronariae TaxID=2795749 RepID=A0A218ZFN0_9HELO|nr:PadR-like family transcriptional regulator [Marssonina coronariae]
MRFSTTLIAITAVLGFAAASEKSPAPDRLLERSYGTDDLIERVPKNSAKAPGFSDEITERAPKNSAKAPGFTGAVGFGRRSTRAITERTVDDLEDDEDDYDEN